MFEAITAEKSLFFLKDDLLVEEFKKVARQHPQFHGVPQLGSIAPNDVWVAAFNAWLLLQPEEDNILESAEKSLYYSSNFIILKELKNDHYFKFIKTQPSIQSSFLFIMALYLAEAINQWLMHLLIAEQREDILTRNRQRSYFDMHTKGKEEVLQFMEDQAAIVKLMMPIISKEDTFEYLIKSSYDTALKQLSKKNLVVEN